MNSLSKFFRRATSKNASQQTLSLSVERLEERQMLSTVDIVAAGATGQETIELIIEGETVAVFENVGGDFDNRDFVTLSYNTDQVINSSEIEVAFTNDLFDPQNGTDRNVLIDRVLLRFDADGTPEEREFFVDRPFSFETEDSSVFSTGTYRPEDGITPGFGRGEILHANGSFKLDGSLGERGTINGAVRGGPGSFIQINALGDTGDEKFNLLIDGKVVQTYDVSNQFSEYRYVSEDVVSPEQIRIEFINDLFDPANGIDRNLIVSSIRVDTRLLQTEAPTTFSTGVYVQGQGIVSGFNQTETLSTNGFFEYLASDGQDLLQFAGENFTTTSNSSQVFVSDGVLTVRGTPDSEASTSRTVAVAGNQLYELSLNAFRDIISGSFNSDSQPWATIGVSFNDANGNIISQLRVDNIARDSQSDGFRNAQTLSPANAESATIWIWAGQTSSGVDIPLRVRDIQFAQVTSSDITPPNVDLIRTPITAPTSAIQFTLEVTDESGLQFVNGPIPEITITGDGGYQVDLNSIAGNGIDGGTAFFYQLSPRSSDQWTSADNGVYSVTVNSGAFSDSVGNLVEQQLAGTFLVSIS